MFKLINKSGLLLITGIFLIAGCGQRENGNTGKEIPLEPLKTHSVGDAEDLSVGEVEETGVLPSWNDTETKRTIVSFVESTVSQDSSGYIKPDNRIAVFDSDGTLWPEKPTYFQIEFIIYRIKKMLPGHPGWKKNKLVQAAVNHDLDRLRKKFGVNGIGKLMSMVQSGMTVEEFEKSAAAWMKFARHPVTGKPYSQMVYKPMLELISYLKANGFKVYLVSGGGLDFMRAWAGELFGIPKENIIGSYSGLKYEIKNGKPVLLKTDEILFVNDGENKVVGIQRFIGSKPVLAFGNSDGDLQMLEWCASNDLPHLQAVVHHTDATREWAYDRNSKTGKLDKTLNVARQKGWLIVDMKKDWKVIFPDKTQNATANN